MLFMLFPLFVVFVLFYTFCAFYAFCAFWSFCAFCAFLCVWNLLVKKKKKKKRGLKLPWYPHLLYNWLVPPSTCLWKSVGIFSFYGNVFCLWESLLVYDHLRGSLFMRISPYLWSSVRIFSLYENLFLFLIICQNLFFLWEFFWISS